MIVDIANPRLQPIFLYKQSQLARTENHDRAGQTLFGFLPYPYGRLEYFSMNIPITKANLLCPTNGYRDSRTL